MLQDSIWQDLSAETAVHIANYAVRRTWPQNATIFRQNDQCTGLHVLQSGAVKLYVADSNGREQIVHMQTNSGPLTLLPLLDGRAYAVSAQAMAPSVTKFVARDQFDWLFSTCADFAFAVARELARRTRMLISVAGSISLKPVVSRVAIYIREQAGQADSLKTRGSFRLPLSQEELAHLVGSTRESVARALAELRRNGAIEQSRATIRILNAKALALYCGDGEATPALVLARSGVDAA